MRKIRIWVPAQGGLRSMSLYSECSTLLCEKAKNICKCWSSLRRTPTWCFICQIRCFLWGLPNPTYRAVTFPLCPHSILLSYSTGRIVVMISFRGNWPMPFAAVVSHYREGKIDPLNHAMQSSLPLAVSPRLQLNLVPPPFIWCSGHTACYFYHGSFFFP